MNDWLNIRCLLLTCMLACYVFCVMGGVSLEGCVDDDDNKYAEVIQTSTNNTFTCRLGRQQTPTIIKWSVNWSASLLSPGGTCINIGDCTDNSLYPAFLTTKTSSIVSIVTIDPSQLKNKAAVTEGTLMCTNFNNSQSDSCTFDYIIPASGTCKTQVQTSKAPWNISVDCSVTRGNSSRGRYGCQWAARKLGNDTDQSTSEWMAMTSNRLSDDKTTCNVSVPLPTENGRRVFCVKLIPGKHIVQTNTIELRRPSTPSITCSPTPVPENSSVSCTCTADVGEPGGQLRWVKRAETNSSNLKNGVSPLNLTRQLTRADHNVTKFACEAVWSNEVKTSENYTAVIGPPIQQSASDEDYGTSIAGGIVVAVVCVVVVVAAIIVIVRRRRKGTQTDKSDNGMQTSDHSNFNGTDESHEDSCRAASGSHPSPLMSIPLCEQPGTLSAASNDRHGTGYEYAAVNKPKGNASAMIANVNPSSAEYANVNTTKKTQKPPAMNKIQAGTADEHADVVKPKKHTLRLEASSTKPADEYVAVMKKTKAKDGKPKSKPKDAMKNNGKKKGPIYGNYVDMNPTKNKTDKQPGSGLREDDQDGRSVNQDGLIYVGVDVSGASKSPSTASKPPDSDERVVYSPIDFSRSK